METEVYIGLGGNVGNVLATLKQAIKEMVKLPAVKQLEVSSFYKTSPVSEIDQPHFFNAVCRFYTSMDPQLLLKHMQAIERKLGKKPKPKQAPRPIDLDILFYGSQIYRSTELEIPHPEWQKRLFVLIPLAELKSFVTIESANGQIQQFFVSDLIEKMRQNSYQDVQLLQL